MENPVITQMFQAGAHFGFSPSRRHPSVRPFIFGTKNKVEIFDLEKTESALVAAKQFVKSLGMQNKQILLVGGKAEARDSIKAAALSIDMPYVAGRWIGGAITNFGEIRSRVDKMQRLMGERERGELAKYTKKERLLIDREIDNLEFYFAGIVLMKDFPKAMFVIDPKREKIAVAEAKRAGIPVIALAGSDCNLKEVEYAIPANDGSLASIRFFLQEIVGAYKEGKAAAPAPAPTPAPAAPVAAPTYKPQQARA